MPDREESRAASNNNVHSPIIWSRSHLEKLADVGRRELQVKIVFTNGVFDILHVGHVRYLQQARALGHWLIVGINSDESVRRLKGPTRPINSAEERAEMLAALTCVDFVTIFEEDTPHETIRAIMPDIHCKGGDYASPDALPETPLVRELGGEVVILPLTPARSTSRLIRLLEGGDNDPNEKPATT